MTNQKRNICCFLLSVLFILSLVSCGEKHIVDTEIKYNSRNFDVCGGKYAVCLETDGTAVYKIKRNSGKLAKYYSFEEECSLVDVNEEKLLFRNDSGYFVFDTEKKKKLRLSDNDFPLSDQYSDVNYRFSEDGKGIVAAKVLKDRSKPVKAGTIILGYKLKEKSGIYVYSTADGKEMTKVLIGGFGIDPLVKLEIILCRADSNNIGVVLRSCPIGTSFADESYYTMNLSDGKTEKIGNYSSAESLDQVLKTVQFGNFYVNMNSQTVKTVDFKNKKISHADMTSEIDLNNSQIYIEENGKFLAFYHSGADPFYQTYTITDDGEMKENKMSTEDFGKYCFDIDSVNAGSQVQLSQKSLEKYSELDCDGEFYKTYSNDCFVAANHGKACIIYKD